jgi:hypothetical protein
MYERLVQSISNIIFKCFWNFVLNVPLLFGQKFSFFSVHIEKWTKDNINQLLTSAGLTFFRKIFLCLGRKWKPFLKINGWRRLKTVRPFLAKFSPKIYHSFIIIKVAFIYFFQQQKNKNPFSSITFMLMIYNEHRLATGNNWHKSLPKLVVTARIPFRVSFVLFRQLMRLH